MDKKHYFKWFFSVSVIVALLFGTLYLINVIEDAQARQKARDVVWNEVSFPKGNVATVIPKLVTPGQTINITFKEYCNKGVDVTVFRWIEFIGADGTPDASFGLRPIIFYGSKYPGGCVKNIIQPFTVPPDLAGRPPGTNLVRLRTNNTYVKPEQIVEVPAFSENFRILPNKGETE